MAEDFKTLTPDTTFTPSTAFLFGADSQSATDPSIYQGSTIFNALLALANTFTATQTITPAANTNALVVTGYSLTGANAQSLIDLAGTWNTSGAPTAVKLNITNTASGATSKLFSYQVDGSSRLDLYTSTQSALIAVDSSAHLMVAGLIATPRLIIDGSGSANGFVKLGSNGRVGWCSGGAVSPSDTADLILARDNANILAQRNGVNAQTYRWYNTFTDASNYERAAITWSSNVAILKTENAGTGSARLLVVNTGTTTVASLPSAATMGAGAISMVTNALTPAFGSNVVGGGAVTTPVYSDGTNWVVG